MTTRIELTGTVLNREVRPNHVELSVALSDRHVPTLVLWDTPPPDAADGHTGPFPGDVIEVAGVGLAFRGQVALDADSLAIVSRASSTDQSGV